MALPPFVEVDIEVPAVIFPAEADVGVDDPTFARKYCNIFYHLCETSIRAKHTTLINNLAASRVAAASTTNLGTTYLAAAPPPQGEDMFSYILAIENAHEARLLQMCRHIRVYNWAVQNLETQQEGMIEHTAGTTTEAEQLLLEVPRVRTPIPRCRRGRVCTECHPPVVAGEVGAGPKAKGEEADPDPDLKLKEADPEAKEDGPKREDADPKGEEAEPNAGLGAKEAGV